MARNRPTAAAGFGIRLAAVLALGLVSLAGTLAFTAVAASGYARNFAPAPPPSEQRVYEASRPAVAFVDSIRTYTTTVKRIVLSSAGRSLVDRLQAGGADGPSLFRAVFADAKANLIASVPIMRETFTDDGYYGTGFFVDENGTMITAAHVATPSREDQQTQLESLFEYLPADQGVEKDLLGALAKSVGLSSFPADSTLKDSIEKWLPSYLKDYASIDTETTSLAVGYGTIPDGSFDSDAARVIAAEDPFPGKDVAVLKVDVRGSVPALALSAEAKPAHGEVADVIGYGLLPGRDISDPLPARFGQGRVDQVDQEPGVVAYGTDADFVGGDSGGPILNSRGEVIGMASYSQTYDDGTSVFGANYFIPASVIRSTLRRAGVSVTPGSLTTDYYRALAQVDRSNYRAAAALLATIEVRSPRNAYVHPEQDQVTAAIRSGKDRTLPGRAWLLPFMALAVLGGVATIVAAGVLGRPARRAPAPRPASPPLGSGSPAGT